MVAPVARAAGAVAGDWRAFIRQMRVAFGRGRSRPGLYSYRFTEGDGRVRLHLRVHPDGAGTLFVDVSDAVCLSAPATELARMLLDGVTPTRAQALFRAWYPDAPAADVERDVATIAALIAALKQPTGGCPTCGLDIARSPLFSTRAAAPHKADVALTYACNNRCAHCYNEPERKGMAAVELRDRRRILRRLADIGVPHIIFTGGEPTLCEDLPALVRYANRLGQVTGLNTNGRRLSEAGYPDRLARAGLEHVQVTLASHRPDAHDRAVGARAFQETVAGIRNALAAGLHTITNTTLTRANHREAVETVEFIHGLGVTTFAMNGMICAGGGRCNPEALPEAELMPLLSAVRDRAGELGMRFLWYTPTEHCRLSPLELELGPKSCNAAEYSICVEPDGAVLPCQSYYEACGNILTDDWGSIWDSELFRTLRMRREAPREAGLPERCWDCADLQVCGGGCPLARMEAEAVCRPQT